MWEKWSGTRDSDLDFFLQVVSARPEVISPYVLIASRGDSPEAILIGRLEKRRVPMPFGYLRLPSPQLRVLDFVYGGLRGNVTGETAELLVGNVLKHLRQGDADLALFEHVAVGSPLYRAVRALPRFFERGISPEHRLHRCLQLPESSEDLYKILPPKHRQNYRRKARKFLKDFPDKLSIERYTQPSDKVFRDVEFIAQKTYQRGLGFGFHDTPELRERFRLAANHGWLRIFILYVAGTPCAYWNAMAYHGTLWGDHFGYDPAYSSYSPGIYLLLTSLSDLCDGKWQDDITQIDFGLGDAEYKSLLSNLSFQESPLYLYGATLKGFLVNLISTPIALADRSARRFLADRDLLASIKRVWRTRETRPAAPAKDTAREMEA